MRPSRSLRSPFRKLSHPYKRCLDSSTLRQPRDPSWHERKIVPPVPPLWTFQLSLLHQTSIALSKGRESNPTRGSGIGPHSRAMSSDLSRESRQILARIPRTDIIQKLLVKFDGV